MKSSQSALNHGENNVAQDGENSNVAGREAIGVTGPAPEGGAEKVRVNLCTTRLDEHRDNRNKPSPSQHKMSIYLLIHEG